LASALPKTSVIVMLFEAGQRPTSLTNRPPGTRAGFNIRGAAPRFRIQSGARNLDEFNQDNKVEFLAAGGVDWVFLCPGQFRSFYFATTR